MSENIGFTDRLTGLKNYECFVSEFDTMVSEAVDKNLDLTLAMIDIDHFMNINEQYGHSVGDEVIKEISNHLVKSTPESSDIYRYAGDQFAILFPNTEKENAFLIVERLRGSFIFVGSDESRQIQVTLSIGISSCPEDGCRITEVVRKAEGALFRAKKSGKNKVCLAREEKMVTKTSHYTYEQLQRLSELAKKEGMGEAILLREALDDLLKKYDY